MIKLLEDIELELSRFLLTLEGFTLSGGGDNYSLNVGGKVYFK